MEACQTIFHKRRSRCSKYQPAISVYRTITKNRFLVTLLLYSSPLRISGAMFKGDPSIVDVKLSLLSSFENPKSAILMLPLCLKMFASFKSLCIILDFTKVLNPFRIWIKYSTAYRIVMSHRLLIIYATSSSVKFFLSFINPIRSPSLQYSRIM